MCGAKLKGSFTGQKCQVSLKGGCGRVLDQSEKGICHYCSCVCCVICRDTCSCGSFWCKVCVSKILEAGALNREDACCDLFQVLRVVFHHKVMPSMREYDIGTFGSHTNTPGVDILESFKGFQHISAERVRNMLCRVNFSQVENDLSKTTVNSREVLKILDAVECLALRTVLDRECCGVADFKLIVTVGELAKLIGIAAVERISSYIEHDFNTIILRRCRAEGLCINFHLDYSQKTMQIALNDDTEYVGGRLVFATNDGALYVPCRPAGSATIHNNTVVHGVSTFYTGVRYGLFFLKTGSGVVA